MDMGDFSDQAACLQREWGTSPRWAGIQRDYRAEAVIRLRASLTGDHTPARRNACQLWDRLSRADSMRAFGDGTPAVPASPSPDLDPSGQMKTMIAAGAAGVPFEDRLPSPAGSGQPGRSVLIPTGEHIATLTAARLMADALNVPTLLIARTYAHEASLLTSDADERDHEFLTGERTAEGLHRVQPGPYARVTRALAFAPYADLLWLEAPAPNLDEARAFANIIYSQYPGKLLAYSCSPSFDWAQLDDASIAQFQDALAALGYRLQVTAAASQQFAVAAA